jgi:site-specific recombinase XerD
MAGMRDYTDDELALVRKSFSGRYALRDRCFFEMALQMGLRVSEMLSLTVGQVYQYGKVVEEVSIDRKHMKGGKAGKASGRTIPLFPETHPHILAWLQRLAGMLKLEASKAIDPSTPLFLSRVRNKDGSPQAIARETAWRIIKAILERMSSPARWGRIAPGRPWPAKCIAGRMISASCNAFWAIGA